MKPYLLQSQCSLISASRIRPHLDILQVAKSMKIVNGLFWHGISFGHHTKFLKYVFGIICNVDLDTFRTHCGRNWRLQCTHILAELPALLRSPPFPPSPSEGCFKRFRSKSCWNIHLLYINKNNAFYQFKKFVFLTFFNKYVLISDIFIYNELIYLL